jgi:hypothetical protein
LDPKRKKSEDENSLVLISGEVQKWGEEE